MKIELTDIEVDVLDDIALGMEATLMSYSGRGMFGKECLGIDMPSMTAAFNLALEIGIDCSATAQKFKNPKFDNMGLGIVVYWPNIAVPQSVTDAENEFADSDY